ncbi:ankyrin repeat domain-containing protein [Paenibacillus odorifer]|uniref:ankyrin repeat domain-containing protein n=1 Tax=Paenibacillus odorifer TaxID=189426 RepID=UPI00097B22F0|nr:ankyrin repeat domain-containing protein [Paenibacillus odorifer]OME41410.1 hypothetical protein BSK58_14850 [Paenibacillus odorifer]
MKMFKKIPTFTMGLVLGIALTAGTAVGAATYLKATPKTMKIVVGSNQKSVEAMSVNDKLYVPVRDAGTSFGYQVSSVTSSIVTFKEGSTTATNKSVDVGMTDKRNNATTSSKTGGEFVQGLHDKYSADGKLDAKKVALAIAAKEITVNAQDEETGNSLMHYAILEDNFALYSVIKANLLNVNLINYEGKTTLHLAVINENRFYLGELQNEFRADAKIKDNSGKLPIDYATKGTSTYNGLQGYMM